jgi:transaldolase
MYIEPLVGPDTITTLPRATLAAYRDHGRPQPTLTSGVEDARRVLRDLADAGLDLDAITRELEADGLEKFNRPYDKLLAREERS